MTDRTPIAISYAMLLMAVAVVAGLSAMVFVLKPKGPMESKPTEIAPPPPPPPPAAAASEAGRIGFRDPENTKRFQSLRAALDSLDKRLAVLDQRTTMPADELDAPCAEIAGLANPLAGEPHPLVQKAGEDAKHRCDFDRPLAVIKLAVRLAQAPGSNRKAICNAAARSTNVLVEKKYGDDEKVKEALAQLGKACL